MVWRSGPLKMHRGPMTWRKNSKNVPLVTLRGDGKASTWAALTHTATGGMSTWTPLVTVGQRGMFPWTSIATAGAGGKNLSQVAPSCSRSISIHKLIVADFVVVVFLNLNMNFM